MEDDRTEIKAELGAAASVAGLMRTASRVAAAALDADACAISRILGDVLIELAEFAGDRPTLYLGHGYLISDYPVTRDAIEHREARAVYAPDADADPKEVALLEELGFTALLMVPICPGGEVWGLAELYREGLRRFVDAEAERATRLFDLVGRRAAELGAGS
jgi:GAF domain-containing protein